MQFKDPCILFDSVFNFQVNPLTMRCRAGGHMLRDFLDEGPDPDVKDLIERGVLIKISSKQVPKSSKRARDEVNIVF